MMQSDSSSNVPGGTRPAPSELRLLALCRQRYAEAVERRLRASLAVWQAQELLPGTLADVLERRFAMALDRRMNAALSGAVRDEALDAALRALDANGLAAQVTGEEAWADLDQRLRTLLHDGAWQRAANPLAPQWAIAALLDAAQAVAMAPAPRVALAGRWARELVPALVRTYAELGAYLAQKGVQPWAAHAAEDGLAGDSAAIEVWDPLASDAEAGTAMQYLLTAAQVADTATAAAPADAGAPAIDVIAWLSDLQRTEAAAMIASGAAAAAWLPADRGLIAALKTMPVYTQIPPADRVMIDVVGLMFDYILGASSIPAPLKPHLSRLQIPVLKAALLDAGFYGDRAHPARALLDLIAESAIGWDESGEAFAGLVRTVGELVQRVLHEFERDLAVFERAAQDFAQFVAVYERASGVAVEPTLAELAQREVAEARADAAQRAAEEAVGMRVADPELPDSVRLFLCQEWVKPLARAWLDEGPDSRAWVDLVGIMDDLIWSVQPKLSADSRQYLVKILPGLLRRLQAAMTAAGIDQEVREEFMGRLVICHAQAVKAGYAPAEPQPVPEESWRALTLARIAQQRSEPALVLPFRREAPATEDLSRLTLQFIHPQAAGTTRAEEIAVEEGEQQLEIVPDDAALLAELRPGMWFSFRRRGGATYEARLKWISPMRRTYLFTDREGRRMATVTAAHLAAALRLGGAVRLEHKPLTERAVNSVIEALKRQAAA